jgi:hypothetical protein
MSAPASVRDVARSGFVKQAALALIVLVSMPAAAAAAPIPEGPRTAGLPDYQGAPATPRPLDVPLPPRHPHMAPNERSNIHVDAYQTDANVLTGPLGRDMSVTSTFYSADCASVTFDSRDRIVTICVGLGGPTLKMLDRRTLAELASFSLPPRTPPGPGENVFQDFAGGGYFYLDNLDRAIIPTTSRHLLVVQATASPGFDLQQDIDLTGHVPIGDKIISALPDWRGLIWFASTKGVVGTVDLGSGRVRSLDTGEPNGNSHGLDDDGGVYIVTDKAMYRFDAGPDGTPTVTWREGYENIGQKKPGQTQFGSGVTPTMMDGGLVAITDNADPMNVVVLKRGRSVRGPRQVCKQPVFEKGASATDNSLVVAGRSIFVENNYGYTGPPATDQGKTTTPGIERVDLNRSGSGCSRVWRSQETSPTVVPKVSLGSGLLYVYAKPPNQPGDGDGWYLTGIDIRTGRTVFRKLTGEGLGFNNNYAPVTIGPDGTAYVGTLGGLVAVRDATPPPQGLVNTSVRMDDSLRPKLRLRVRVSRGCTARARTSVTGADRGLVDRVDFKLGNRRAGSDTGAPFRRTIRVRRKRSQTIRAIATMSDGGRRILRRTLAPRCARVAPSLTG